MKIGNQARYYEVYNEVMGDNDNFVNCTITNILYRKMKLTIGGIYLIDRTSKYDGLVPIEALMETCRVLCYDDFETFLDIDLQPGKNDWAQNKMSKGTIYFGRRSMVVFEEHSTEIGFSEVPEKVKSHLHTHCLMRIGRTMDLSWDSRLFEDKNSFYKFIGENTAKQWQEQIIDSPSILIEPFGKKGKSIPSVKIDADNGKYFTTAEVLYKSFVVQAEIFPFKSEGIGIYRTGVKKGIPTYYLWDYFDRAGTMNMYVSRNIKAEIITEHIF